MVFRSALRHLSCSLIGQVRFILLSCHFYFTVSCSLRLALLDVSGNILFANFFLVLLHSLVVNEVLQRFEWHAICISLILITLFHWCLSIIVWSLQLLSLLILLVSREWSHLLLLLLGAKHGHMVVVFFLSAGTLLVIVLRVYLTAHVFDLLLQIKDHLRHFLHLERHFKVVRLSQHSLRLLSSTAHRDMLGIRLAVLSHFLRRSEFLGFSQLYSPWVNFLHVFRRDNVAQHLNHWCHLLLRRSSWRLRDFRIGWTVFPLVFSWRIFVEKIVLFQISIFEICNFYIVLFKKRLKVGLLFALGFIFLRNVLKVIKLIVI